MIDVLDDTGQVLSFLELRNKYKIKDINFLNHFRVKTNAERFLKKNRIQTTTTDRPYILNHVKVLLCPQKGASIFYKSVNLDRQNTHTMKGKWNEDLNIRIDNDTWATIFHSFYNLNNNNLIWFQTKVLYRILGTKVYLKKVGISEQYLCSLCKHQPETLVHLFFECAKSQEIWKSLEIYINLKTRKVLHFSKLTVLLGYLLQDQNAHPLNLVIVTTKQYIFETSKLNTQLSMTNLLYKLRKNFTERQLLARLNDQEVKFTKNWKIWIDTFACD